MSTPTDFFPALRRLLLTGLLVLSTAGCERDDVYPVTGDECGPGDAVRGMDASDCAVTPGTVSSM